MRRLKLQQLPYGFKNYLQLCLTVKRTIFGCACELGIGTKVFVYGCFISNKFSENDYDLS